MAAPMELYCWPGGWGLPSVDPDCLVVLVSGAPAGARLPRGEGRGAMPAAEIAPVYKKNEKTSAPPALNSGLGLSAHVRKAPLEFCFEGRRLIWLEFSPLGMIQPKRPEHVLCCPLPSRRLQPCLTAGSERSHITSHLKVFFPLVMQGMIDPGVFRPSPCPRFHWDYG